MRGRLRGKGSVLPDPRSAGLAGSQRGRRFFGPDAGETCAHLAGSVPIPGKTRTERLAPKGDPGKHARTDGAGDLRSTRGYDGAGPVDYGLGRSPLGRQFDLGRDLGTRPPPRAGKVAPDRYLSARRCFAFPGSAKNSETGFAGPPSLPRNHR